MVYNVWTNDSGIDEWTDSTAVALAIVTTAQKFIRGTDIQGSLPIRVAVYKDWQAVDQNIFTSLLVEDCRDIDEALHNVALEVALQ